MGKKIQRQFIYLFIPLITGIENKMLLLLFLSLIAMLTSVSGECNFGHQNVNINWNEVRIGVLTELEYGRYWCIDRIGKR
jgi:hypothetical protein